MRLSLNFHRHPLRGTPLSRVAPDIIGRLTLGSTSPELATVKKTALREGRRKPQGILAQCQPLGLGASLGRHSPEKHIQTCKILWNFALKRREMVKLAEQANYSS